MTSASTRISGQICGKLPDFIGVGPPRTATTWLHEALSGHVGLPQTVKETDFFVYKYDNGLKWYEAHFRNCPDDRPIGEFSPNYFIGTQTRERIIRHIPECKIICTLRDPVERTYSHYRKGREGEYFSGSFEECLEKRADILEWSKYATHLTAWRRLFGTENVLILIQDDLKADAQAFLNRVCDFIRIARFQLSDPTMQDKLVNSIPTQPRYPRIAYAARIVRDRLQKKGNYALVNSLKRTGLRNFLFSGGPAYQPMRSETEARLREYFRSEVEAMEEMLGRDLSRWMAVRTGSSINQR
jgi:Sulfotransferase domain